MLHKTSIALILVAVAASGCSRSSNALSGVSTQSPPQALPSVPSGSVQSSQLDPIGNPQPLQPGLQPAQNGTLDPNGQPATAPGTQVAAIDQSQSQAPAKPLTNEQLAGSWNVNSDSASCRAVLAFTKWDYGYRAKTLRCNSQELSSVAAWDIKNNRVVLVDTNGTQVASLVEIGNERYSGQTSSGQPVSFSR